MMTVSVEEAQRRWDELLDQVITNHEPVLIRSASAEAVLVSAEDYDAWLKRSAARRPPEDTSDAAKPLATEQNQ